MYCFNAGFIIYGKYIIVDNTIVSNNKPTCNIFVDFVLSDTTLHATRYPAYAGNFIVIL